jgi:hypothetical protein
MYFYDLSSDADVARIGVVILEHPSEAEHVAAVANGMWAIGNGNDWVNCWKRHTGVAGRLRVSDDAMEKPFLLYRIENGIEQADAGHTVSHEEAEQRAGRWLDQGGPLRLVRVRVSWTNTRKERATGVFAESIEVVRRKAVNKTCVSRYEVGADDAKQAGTYVEHGSGDLWHCVSIVLNGVAFVTILSSTEFGDTLQPVRSCRRVTKDLD